MVKKGFDAPSSKHRAASESPALLQLFALVALLSGF